MHPNPVILPSLLALILMSGLGGFGRALWLGLRGPRRLAALGLGLAALLPAGLWVAAAGSLLSELKRGDAPHHPLSRLAIWAVPAAMEALAFAAYPRRLETDRLVMFYDERVTDPHRDAAAMERHVARLAALTGRAPRAKIYWIRGAVLGYGRMANAGLALGSARSPVDWESADHPDRLSVDRHELAHAFLMQQSPPDTEPPMLLSEGWAESQSGPTRRRRAAWAWESRTLWLRRTGHDPRRSYLGELVGRSWYHRIDGPVYNVGGALADHLIRTYGAERFLRLYFACRPGTFERECRSRLGVDLATLERRFWAEVERLARGG